MVINSVGRGPDGTPRDNDWFGFHKREQQIGWDDRTVWGGGGHGRTWGMAVGERGSRSTLSSGCTQSGQRRQWDVAKVAIRMMHHGRGWWGVIQIIKKKNAQEQCYEHTGRKNQCMPQRALLQPACPCAVVCYHRTKRLQSKWTSLPVVGKYSSVRKRLRLTPVRH